MVGAWPHPPGTLRALRAVFGEMNVVCHRCRRWVSMSFTARQADRKAHPCPYRCSVCLQRGDIVFPDRTPRDYLEGGKDLGPPAHRPSF